MNRVADLTWNRPKLVLAAVAAFALLAVAFGHDVEHHLKAAGFTDPASESERATNQLAGALGYDAQPRASSSSSVPPAAAGSTPASPTVRRDVARLSAEVAKAEYVGRVVDPLRDPRAGP